MKFGIGREQQPIHEISAMDLDQWIDQMSTKAKWSLSTKRAYTLAFGNLWTVAIAKG
jgi:hypothetical protein